MPDPLTILLILMGGLALAVTFDSGGSDQSDEPDLDEPDPDPDPVSL